MLPEGEERTEAAEADADEKEVEQILADTDRAAKAR